MAHIVGVNAGIEMQQQIDNDEITDLRWALAESGRHARHFHDLLERMYSAWSEGSDTLYDILDQEVGPLFMEENDRNPPGS